MSLQLELKVRAMNPSWLRLGCVCVSARHLDVMIAVLCKEGHKECFDGFAPVQCAFCAHFQPTHDSSAVTAHQAQAVVSSCMDVLCAAYKQALVIAKFCM